MFGEHIQAVAKTAYGTAVPDQTHFVDNPFDISSADLLNSLHVSAMNCPMLSAQPYPASSVPPDMRSISHERNGSWTSISVQGNASS
jgi:hypothetical protein